jgi:phosphoribosyl-AMP cyclohydrolase
MIDIAFEKAGGLVPAIAQDWQSGEVLMLAYMNRDAWEMTLTTGLATYFSRSRNALWVKGKTSGNLQTVKEIRLDCDNDTILLKIDQADGAACHLGYRSCFFKKVTGDHTVVDSQRVFDPEEVYRK